MILRQPGGLSLFHFGRLLYVCKERTEESLHGFFNILDSETITTALYHQLGNLPEPKRTHRFCG
jgi:hypothetical protein